VTDLDYSCHITDNDVMFASADNIDKSSRKPTIAIIGGGFSGAAIALHVNRLAPGAAQFTVIEPREAIGQGLAYSTPDPSHRINVPATRMQVFPNDPDHFERWYAASPHAPTDPDAQASNNRVFPSRSVFGAYVGEQIAQLASALTHIRARAIGVTHIAGGYRVSCWDGQVIDADAVVLAVCHPPPSAPAALHGLANDPAAVIADPWQPEAFDDVAADAHVLIVGTGLTMADIVATLDRRGHRGQITAISRRGQRSQSHTETPVDPIGDFLSPPSATALGLLRRIRRTVANAARHGQTWHGVLDQVRIQASDIWRALPLQERGRLLRYLRPFWDTHRFRVAPQIQRIIERRLTSGQLTLHAASLRQVKRLDTRLQVTLLDARRNRQDQITVDRIVLATGPAHGSLFRNDPLLRSLEQGGLAHSDPLGLGVEVDQTGRAINRQGTAERGLFVAGPLARGTFGELMGVPDVSRHALRVAEQIDELLRLGDVSRSSPCPALCRA
jgi:uncharacterized NAD(P)/FAD-binding protein YdhS